MRGRRAAAVVAAMACGCGSSGGATGPGDAGGTGNDSGRAHSSGSGTGSGADAGSTLETLYASNEINASRLAIDSTNVYFVLSALGGGGTDVIMKVPLGGGKATTLAAASTTYASANISGLAADGTDVYWTEYTGLVEKVSVSGGARATIASGVSDPRDLVVDGSNAYWIAVGSAVMQAPLGGGTPVSIGPVAGGAGLAVDSSNVYFAGAAGIVSVPIGGGTVTTLAAGQNDATQVGIHDGTVFWTLAGGIVMSVPTAGGTPTTLFPTANPASLPTYFAVDGTDVYVVGDGLGCTPSPAGILAVPIDGGKAKELITGTYGNAIAVDSTSIYTIQGGGCTGGTTALVRVTK